MADEQRLKMFKELTEAPGAPGFEGRVRQLMADYLKPFSDELITDRLGSIVGKKVGDPAGPRVLVAGHMDEVAFMVTQITEEGFLRFQTLGGWWEQVMLAQRVKVYTRSGEAIVGVIGSKPPHILPAEERKKPVKKEDMFIDIGASSKEEAERFGVRPGDVVIPVTPFTVMKNPKLLLAKAWDNRIGCAMAIEVLKRLQAADHPNVVYAGATVQEEVGLRGGQTLANTVQPDVAFAVDVGIAGDTPGIRPQEAQAKLGKGPQVLLYDASMIPHVGLRNLVLETAEELNIPFQYDAMAGGGTDAGRFHLQGIGVPTMVISIPTRYIHSHVSILHEDDFEHGVQLLVGVIQKLNRATVERLHRGE